MSLEGIGFGYRERAPYASNPAFSRGRLVPEPESPTRTPFQRDRDRIIHSTAFRRLKHKTQVFIAHEGDHYRTRLTHTIEVAQIARRWRARCALMKTSPKLSLSFMISATRPSAIPARMHSTSA